MPEPLFCTPMPFSGSVWTKPSRRDLGLAGRMVWLDVTITWRLRLRHQERAS